MKTAVTKRMDTIKNPHNKQEMEKTIFQGKNVQKKTRRVGGWEVRQWRTATRKVGNLISHVTSTPRTLAPRPPDVCEENVFRFFRASASGKQHFSLSFSLAGKGQLRTSIFKTTYIVLVNLQEVAGSKNCSLLLLEAVNFTGYHLIRRTPNFLHCEDGVTGTKTDP